MKNITVLFMAAFLLIAGCGKNTPQENPNGVEKKTVETPSQKVAQPAITDKNTVDNTIPNKPKKALNVSATMEPVPKLTLELSTTVLLKNPSLKDEDGYALFIQACNEFENLHIKDNPAKLCDEYIKNGCIENQNLLEMAVKIQKSVDLFKLAYDAKTFNFPKAETISILHDNESTDILSPSCRKLRSLVAVDATLKIKAGKPEECLKLLFIANEIANRMNKESGLINNLLEAKCRSREYAILTSAVDALPQNKLNEWLIRWKHEYHHIPRYIDVLTVEKLIASNTIKDIFKEIKNDENLKNSRIQMIDDFRKKGVDPKVIAAIENGEILSFDKWESQAISDLNEFYALYTKNMEYASAAELDELDKKIAEWFDNLKKDIKEDITKDVIFLMINNLFTKDISLDEARDIQVKLGKGLSFNIISVMTPNISKCAVSFQNYFAFERLLLVRLATRAYQNEKGKFPDNPQQLVDEKLLEPDMIIDPFTGKPFFHKTMPEGDVVFYSASKDGADSGMMEWNPATKSGDLFLKELKITGVNSEEK